MTILRLPDLPRSRPGEELVKPLRERLQDIIDRGADTHGQVVANLAAARVRRHVRALPELERHVIVWRYGLAGPALSARTVATRLGVATQTVERIEQAALSRLRDSYAEAA